MGTGTLVHSLGSMNLSPMILWTGIGAVGTVLIGIFVFKEPATPIRLFFLFTLIASLIGLKIVSY